MTATKRRRPPLSISATADHPEVEDAGVIVPEAAAAAIAVDFATLIDRLADDITGISFGDLVDSSAVVDALVMVATVATQGRNPERGAYLLRQAARRMLALPMEYLVTDTQDNEDAHSAV